MAYADLFRAIERIPYPDPRPSPMGDGRFPRRLSTDGVWLAVEVRCYHYRSHWWTDLYVREDKATPKQKDLGVWGMFRGSRYYLVRALDKHQEGEESIWLHRRTEPLHKSKYWRTPRNRKPRRPLTSKGLPNAQTD